MKLVIRDQKKKSPVPAEVYLEQEGDNVIVCVEDTGGEAWELVIIKSDGVLELCPFMESDGFQTTDDGYVVVIKG
jgi:hypothetical protein